MGAGLRIVFGASRLLHDTGRVVDIVDKLTTHPSSKWDGWAITTTTINFSLGAAQIIATLAGASYQVQHGLKLTELVVRAVDIPIQIGQAVQDPRLSTIMKVERSIRSISAFTRTLSEQQALLYRAYNEMSVEELEQLGIDPREVPSLLESATKLDEWSLAFGAVEAMCDWKGVSTAYSGIIFNPAPAPNAAHAPNPAAAHAPNPALIPQALAIGHGVFEVPVDEENFFDLFLIALPFIPEELYEDVVLIQYECPILHRPIRHPVPDPTVEGNAQVWYERSAITEWVRAHSTSPWTARRLLLDQLVIDDEAQQVIDERLRLHQQSIRAQLVALAAVPNAVPDADSEEEE